MFLLELNEATAARRRVPVVLVDVTDGVTAETGVTLSAGDMKISKNGGAEANHAGTLTELAGGDYYYEFAAAELDTAGYVTGRIVKAGVRTFRIAGQVVAFDPYAALATQASIDTIDDFLDTEVAAIKAKTDNLPASPANEATLTTIAGYLDTEIAAIKAKTDNLPASPAAVGSAMTLTSGERTSVADALLDRDMATGADSGGRTVRNALRFLRNKWGISGTTLTVTKEDDTTSAWTATVTGTAGADPITGSDPA